MKYENPCDLGLLINVFSHRQVGTCPESIVKFAGCSATKSSKVSSINECPVADNLSQNIQPTATLKKHQDATDEGDFRKILYFLTLYRLTIIVNDKTDMGCSRKMEKMHLSVINSCI